MNSFGHFVKSIEGQRATIDADMYCTGCERSWLLADQYRGPVHRGVEVHNTILTVGRQFSTPQRLTGSRGGPIRRLCSQGSGGWHHTELLTTNSKTIKSQVHYLHQVLDWDIVTIWYVQQRTLCCVHSLVNIFIDCILKLDLSLACHWSLLFDRWLLFKAWRCSHSPCVEFWYIFDDLLFIGNKSTMKISRTPNST